MASNAIKKLCIICFLLYLPFQSLAWGLLGHRIVGEIADRNISRKTGREIRKILGTESIAIASNWADFIKADSTYDYLGSWHYINFGEGLTHDAFNAYLRQDTATNAYTRLNFLVKELKNKQLPQDKKQLYLRLVIHLVGDMHQPLHAGRAEDLGGNRIKVYWFGEPTNLHRLWDGQLLESQQLSYTEYSTALNHATKAQRCTWQQQPVSQWLFESYQISNRIYNDTAPEAKLSYKYNFDYVDTLNEQLLKGGLRLAGLLNEIFG